jgi:hypothetical protein
MFDSSKFPFLFRLEVFGTRAYALPKATDKQEKAVLTFGWG